LADVVPRHYRHVPVSSDNALLLVDGCYIVISTIPSARFNALRVIGVEMDDAWLNDQQ